MNLLDIRVGFFLASRQIRRSSFWVTTLIIFVMMTTFLNLVVVSGILVGLIAGSSNDFRSHYSGDILIKPKKENKLISNSKNIVDIADSLPHVLSISTRYLAPVQLEADYKTLKKGNEAKNLAPSTLAGIDPANEDAVTHLSDFIIEGEYLDENDTDAVLIGSSLLKKYSDALSENTLDNVEAGSKIRMIIGDSIHEVTVKGVIKIKVGDVSQRVFMNKNQMLVYAKQNRNDAGEIAMILDPSIDPVHIKNDITNSGISESADVQTWEEAQGKFFKDLSSTFTILGNVIGSIGLAVASVTIFIVIFINAISRKKFIGILKGIGVSGSSIRYSYVFQSIFYASVGSLLGLLILYGLLVPFFDKNPIDFPFSDGILAVTPDGTLWRLGLLFFSTLIAGFLPAQLVIRKNTLDSILGR